MITAGYSFGRLGTVDLRLLRVFTTIVACGGFKAAESRLDATASSISTDMSNLETRLGMRLCRRGRAGFHLTEDGEVVHREALRLFEAAEAFATQVARRKGQLVGELRIGIMDNSVFDPSTPLPGRIELFTGRHPEVHLVLEVLPPREIEEAILDGRLHLGIGVFSEPRAGLRYRLSFSEQFDLFCSPSHPLFDQAPDKLDAQAVAEAPYAAGIHGDQLGAALPACFRRPAATTRQSEGLAYLIQSGRYIGYLPRRYAEIWVSVGRMRSLLPDTYGRDATFSVASRPETRRQPIVESFLAELG